jgi:ferric-dicitrate binding protein FerR (iron transport regulator)
MDSISELISRYLDDDLDDQAFDRLSDLLRGNDSATDDLAINSYIHSQLIDLTSRRRVQGSVADDAFIDGVGANRSAQRIQWSAMVAGPATSKVTSDRREAGSAATRLWFRHPMGLAAAVMIAAGVLALTYWSHSRPLIVAQLSRAVGCHWLGPDSDLPIGTLLRAGQELNLSEGRALVTFASGTQVVLEGPSRLRLESAGAAELSFGRITTTVPTQAIGFTISSPNARFIDLGTEFGLRVDTAKGFELHVFDGLVEVQFVGREGHAAPKPLRISEISAIHYDDETGAITSGPCDENEWMSL